MPKAAARVFLMVEDVRPERLQKITVADAIAEGSPNCLGVSTCGGCDLRCEAHQPVGWYSVVWDRINGKIEGGRYAWKENPWVWVYRFKRVEKPERWMAA
jgi:hypothetical protein